MELNYDIPIKIEYDYIITDSITYVNFLTSSYTDIISPISVFYFCLFLHSITDKKKIHSYFQYFEMCHTIN